MPRSIANIQLELPKFPLIYLWIQSDFDKCKDFSDLIHFFHKCLNISESTNNPVKKEAYLETANNLYLQLKYLL